MRRNKPQKFFRPGLRQGSTRSLRRGNRKHFFQIWQLHLQGRIHNLPENRLHPRYLGTLWTGKPRSHDRLSGPLRSTIRKLNQAIRCFCQERISFVKYYLFLYKRNQNQISKSEKKQLEREIFKEQELAKARENFLMGQSQSLIDTEENTQDLSNRIQLSNTEENPSSKSHISRYQTFISDLLWRFNIR